VVCLVLENVIETYWIVLMSASCEEQAAVSIVLQVQFISCCVCARGRAKVVYFVVLAFLLELRS